jgi:hypothetical protein
MSHYSDYSDSNTLESSNDKTSIFSSLFTKTNFINLLIVLFVFGCLGGIIYGFTRIPKPKKNNNDKDENDDKDDKDDDKDYIQASNKTDRPRCDPNSEYKHYCIYHSYSNRHNRCYRFPVDDKCKKINI